VVIKEDNHRFVVIIDKKIFKKFKEIAQKENRSASNLASTLIKKYVENSQNSL
jgi:hypothetical protein